MDRTEAMICQNLYWPNIRFEIQKEVTNFDSCQCTKLSNKQYGKLPAILAEEIPWKQIYVDLVVPHAIRTKVLRPNRPS